MVFLRERTFHKTLYIWKWFDVFNNVSGSGIQYTLSKFGEDIKPCHEGRDAIPYRLKWVSGNLLKSNNTKCKVLHQDW